MRAPSRQAAPQIWRVEIKRSLHFTYKTCGKPVRRQKTFSEKIGMTNKNADGTPKPARELLTALQMKVDVWDPPHYCAEHMPKKAP